MRVHAFAALFCVLSLTALSEEPVRHLLTDFQNAEEIKKVSTGDSGAVEMSIAPRSA